MVTLKGYTANVLGLSTDAKPTTGVDTNTIFRELDTGKRYYFNGSAWAEIPQSGGGGGGDVTSVNGKTGTVVLGASDVGAYTTAETDTLLGGKADKVSGASAGDLAGLGANGNLTDSGINAAVIPSTASTSNKLSTATDTAKEDITAIANSDDIALTDSTDARVHDLKIYGKTEDGHSVGENGLAVTACGKNLSPIDEYLVDYLQNWSDAFNNVIKPNVTYTLSIRMSKARSKNTNFRLVTSSDQYAVVCSLSPEETSKSVTFTLSEPVVNSYRYADALGESDPATCYLQIEKGSMATAWEPYKSYTENIITALPLRRKMLSVDLGDFDWYYQENAHTEESGILFPRFYTTTKAQGMFDPTRFIRGDGRCDTYLITNEACSSRYTVSNSAGGHEPVTDKTIIMGRDGTIYVIDNSYTDPAAFKTAVTGITLTYPSYCDEIDLADSVAITRLDSNGDVLATPVTTPLTDAEKAAFAEFRTFDGDTNVTATDDPFMSLTYVKNTDNGKAVAEVDNIAAARMAMIAAPYDDTATYAVGDYCTYGNKLWKCSTAIGTAEPFTAAHWTATTVMEEIQQ